MAGSINKVILLGRLGADPEIRVSQEGNKIARFSVLFFYIRKPLIGQVLFFFVQCFKQCL